MDRFILYNSGGEKKIRKEQLHKLTIYNNVNPNLFIRNNETKSTQAVRATEKTNANGPDTHLLVKTFQFKANGIENTINNNNNPKIVNRIESNDST